MKRGDYCGRRRAAGCVWLIVACAVVTLGANAPDRQHAHQAIADGDWAPQPVPMLARNAKPFRALMAKAMTAMDGAMKGAPMTGDPDHDFAAMMIPHHQGAVDMAKAELLFGKDPILRRLAQEILVTQMSEIAVMQGELGKQPTSATMHH